MKKVFYKLVVLIALFFNVVAFASNQTIKNFNGIQLDPHEKDYPVLDNTSVACKRIGLIDNDGEINYDIEGKERSELEKLLELNASHDCSSKNEFSDCTNLHLYEFSRKIETYSYLLDTYYYIGGYFLCAKVDGVNPKLSMIVEPKSLSCKISRVVINDSNSSVVVSDSHNKIISESTKEKVQSSTASKDEVCLQINSCLDEIDADTKVYSTFIEQGLSKIKNKVDPSKTWLTELSEKYKKFEQYALQNKCITDLK